MRPRRESNPHQQLRRLLLYPLSYGDKQCARLDSNQGPFA